MRENNGKFIDLGRPRRIWAVGAAHADVDRLERVHAHIAPRFRIGDRLVYLGDLIGWGSRVLETIDAVLAFRRAVLAVPAALVDDVVVLRGPREELWTKTLQLHFAPNPIEVLDWAVPRGLESVILAYGGEIERGYAAARGGPVHTGRWTQTLRAAMAAHPGHEMFFNTLRRAALVRTRGGGALFVAAGLDPTQPLDRQGDAFWWNAGGFARLSQPYEGFSRVVRGYDPARGGPASTEHTVTLDGDRGDAGGMACALLTPDGEVEDLFTT